MGKSCLAVTLSIMGAKVSADGLVPLYVGLIVPGVRCLSIRTRDATVIGSHGMYVRGVSSDPQDAAL